MNYQHLPSEARSKVYGCLKVGCTSKTSQKTQIANIPIILVFQGSDKQQKWLIQVMGQRMMVGQGMSISWKKKIETDFLYHVGLICNKPPIYNIYV